MAGPSSYHATAEQEASFTSSSPPTSSSSRPSTSSHPSASSSRSNLPQAPPPGRIPPPKGRSLHAAGQKLGLGRRKDRDKKKKDDGDEEWTLEDGAIGRASVDGEREELLSMDNSQMTEKPAKESKGKRLAHKTSQLFSRKDKDKDRPADDSQSNLNLPTTSRQTSYSSVASGESSRTNGSSNLSSNIQRPPSNPSRQSSAMSVPVEPKRQHSRRISQDSQMSWHGIQRTIRSGSSSGDSPTETHLPIPRRQSSNLSASVPALSRNALPQPGPHLAPSSMSTRMSSWFTHLISTSSSPETVVAASPEPPSPARKPTSAAASFLNAARQRAVDGVRNLLLDTEAQPDKSAELIWLMGTPHPGYVAASPLPSPSVELPDPLEERRGSGSSGRPSPPSKSDSLRPAAWPKKKDTGPMSPPNRSLGQLLTGSAISLGSPGKQDGSAESPGRRKAAGKEKEVLKWPDAFYDDFRTRVWCSYRGQYAPILPLPQSLLIPSPGAYYSAFASSSSTALSSSPVDVAGQAGLATKPSSWGWSKPPEERGLTSDAGWGCMLRTGQSLLANALINLHLGREWRIPPTKPIFDPLDPATLPEAEAYATYVRILSYFMDDPSPLCPFSVHRMALIGKELGKEVGEWFGPSTASGALKTLADAFPPCGLAVSTATDGIVYKSDVYAASHLPEGDWGGDGKDARSVAGRWGHKAVLILVGLRLGLDGVNPIYHDSIKALFKFPQSVGIAGGRPNTSYYFVASQGNYLFYLDPHFTRPAVQLEIPPAATGISAQPRSSADTGASSVAPVLETPLDVDEPPRARMDMIDVDDISDDSDDSLSPTKNRPKRGRHAKKLSIAQSIPRESPPLPSRTTSTPTTPIPPSSSKTADVFDAPQPSTSARDIDVSTDTGEAPLMDPQTAWYIDAYTETQLRTFHSDKVRKMPLSGLDPSMLLGFLVRDEADFEDFCRRVSSLPQKIFSVQEEPPTWDDDDAAGLESVSEPDLSDEDGLARPIPGGDEEELLADPELVTLDTRPTLRQAPKVSVEEDEWDAPSPIPILGGVIDRSATPSSIPVLVERPSMDMPKNAIPASPSLGRGQGGNGDGRALMDEGEEQRGGESGGREEEEDMATSMDMGQPRRPAQGARGMMRQRTDSWVKPDRPDDI